MSKHHYDFDATDGAAMCKKEISEFTEEQYKFLLSRAGVEFKGNFVTFTLDRSIFDKYLKGFCECGHHRDNHVMAQGGHCRACMCLNCIEVTS